MALPVTITGISTAVASVGPFKLIRTGDPITLFRIATSTASANAWGQTAADQRISQTFTTGAGGGSVASIAFSLTKNASPTDDIKVDIFACSAGVPTGSSLGTSTTVAGSSLTATATQTQFAFTTPVTLSASTQYAAVLSRSGAVDPTNNYIVWHSGANINSAEGSNAYNGTAWGTTSSLDFDLTVMSSATYSSDQFYFFGRDGTTATTLQAFKSTAPDTSWSSIATKTGFTTAILYIAAYQINNVTHLLVQDGTQSSSMATKYLSFDAVTDTFLTTVETVSAAQALTGQLAAGWGCGLVARSDGTVVTFYNGLQTKTSGTFRARVYYRVRTGINTYGTETQVDQNVANDARTPLVALGSSDRTHLIWDEAATTRQRALNSSNTLQTGAAVASSSGSPQDVCSFNDAGTTRLVGFSASDNFYWASADTPTITRVVTTFGTPVRTVDDGTDVYALYQSSVDSDLYIKKSTDFGASFGSAISAFVGTVAATTLTLSKNQYAYQRGSTVVFPYIVNDNGTLKYNEYTVRTVGATLVASTLTNTAPTLGAPAFAEVVGNVRTLVAANLSNTAPVLGPATFAQKQVLTAATLTNTAPVLGPATFAQTSALVAATLANTSPVLNNANFAQQHALGASALSTGPPTLGPATITQKQVLVASALANSAPTLGPATLTINSATDVLVAATLSNTAPVLGPATFAQKQVLTAVTLANAAPTLGPATITQAHTLVAVALGAGVGVTTLDPANKYSSIALSNGNLTATGINASNVDGVVFSTTSRSSGKIYIEVTANSTTRALVGIANASEPTSNFPGINNNGISSYDIGTQFVVGGFPAIGATTTWTTGDVVCLAIDVDNKLIWQRVNGGTWNGNGGTANPVTGVNGCPFPSGMVGGPYNFALVPSNSATTLTVNFGATAYAYTRPSGFGDWQQVAPHVLFGAPVLVGNSALAAAVLTNASPALGLAALGQKHVLIAATLTNAAPVIPGLVLGISGVMSAAPLINTAPVLGPATLGQKHALTAATLANTAPVLGPAIFALPSSLVASTLTNTAPTLGPATLGQQHVLTAATLANGAPVLGPATFSERQVLTAATLANTAPVLGPAAIGQKHVLSAATLANASPVIPGLVLGITGVMAAAPLINASPTLGAPLLVATSALVAATLANSAPTLGAPTFGQKHVLSAATLTNTAPTIPGLVVGIIGVMAAAPLINSAPTLGPAVLTQNQVLSAAPLTNTSPILGAPVLPASLTAANFANTSPVLGPATITQQHVLTAAPLSNSAPVVPGLVLGIVGVMACAPLINSAPILGPATLTQKQVLAASALANSAPTLGPATLTGTSILTAATLTNAAPVLGVPVLIRNAVLVAATLTNTAPVLNPATIKQQHALTTAALANTAPVLGPATITQRHVLAAANLFNTSPVLGPAAFSEKRILTAAPLINSAPVLGPTYLTVNSGRITQRYSIVAQDTPNPDYIGQDNAVVYTAKRKPPSYWDARA